MFRPMSQLQHGLSSSAANVEDTTGLPTSCSAPNRLLRILILIVICDFYCRKLATQYAWTRYYMLMDSVYSTRQLRK